MRVQTHRVFAEAAVSRTPRRLDVRDAPMRGTEHAQKRLRVHGSGAHFDVERLLQHTPARGPELRQLENEALECHDTLTAASPSTRAPTSDPSPDASRSARDATFRARAAPSATRARPSWPSGSTTGPRR